jgi:hypothetical protein
MASIKIKQHGIKDCGAACLNYFDKVDDWLNPVVSK